MAVFLTGASGFLGQALVRTFRARGKEVRALVRPQSDTRALDLEKISTVLGDVRDASSVRAGLAGCRAVVHCATVTTASAPKREFEETNIQGFRNVMEAAWQQKVPIVVHVSCFLALGPTSGAVADEEHAVPDRRGATLLEETVRVVDRLSRSYVSGGVPLCVVYPGLVYGPGPVRGGNLVSRLIVARAKGGLGSLPLDPESRVSLAYIDDVAEGICRALERGTPGDRFVLGGENVSFPEFFQTLEQVSGLIAPRGAGSLVGARARLADWSARIRGQDSIRGHLNLDLMRNDWSYSSARAVDRLDYSSRPLKDGLKRTVDYLVRKAHL